MGASMNKIVAYSKAHCKWQMPVLSILCLILFAGVASAEAESEDTIQLWNEQAQTFEDRSPVQMSDAEWKNKLGSSAFHILREEGTEQAYSGKHLKEKREGVFVCAACGNHLFRTKNKFESGTGWPSFTRAVNEKNVRLKEDRSLWSTRTEVECALCGGHLGHVFADGPPPENARYCINSESLAFEPN